MKNLIDETVKIRSTEAFTLAEVLITLAVIGIVAAMTIPTLINNYQKKDYHFASETNLFNFAAGNFKFTSRKRRPADMGIKTI